MLQRLLLPIEGSGIADSMLERLAFIRDGQIPVTLLSVVDSRQQIELTGPSAVEVQAEESTKRVTELAERLAREGCNVKARVDVGVVSDVILDVAKEENTTLLAMCTRGRTGVARVLSGSTTERVLRDSTLPLMVVPALERSEPKGGVPRESWDFKSIVVALDGSRQAMQVIPYVAEMAMRFESKVTLLIVLDPGAPEDVVARATKHLEGAVRKFHEAGVVEGSTEIRRGQPAEEIVDYAARYDHDCIMMTTHGRSGISRMLLGSVAESVLRHASVPVVVIRSTK